MFHVGSVPIVHTTPLRAGQVAYIMRRYDMEQWLGYMEKYEIPEINAVSSTYSSPAQHLYSYLHMTAQVPPIIISVIMSPLCKKYSLKKVMLASCGAAPLDSLAMARFKTLLHPKAVFSQVWGMTETTCIATMLYWPNNDDTGSVGKLLPNMEAKYNAVSEHLASDPLTRCWQAY